MSNAASNEMRFSDVELIQMRNDVAELKKMASDHADWRDEQDKRIGRLMTALERNTDNVDKLTHQVQTVVRDTADIIALHKDLQSAARLGSKVQEFIFWLAKFGAIGAFLAASVTYFMRGFKL